MKLFNCVSKLEKQLKELELQGLTAKELVDLAAGIKDGFKSGKLEDETIVVDALSEIVEELGKRVAELEGRVPEQPTQSFVPEDSNGKHLERQNSSTTN